MCSGVMLDVEATSWFRDGKSLNSNCADVVEIGKVSRVELG